MRKSVIMSSRKMRRFERMECIIAPYCTEIRILPKFIGNIGFVLSAFYCWEILMVGEKAMTAAGCWLYIM
jgi:hypothetical protein